MRAIRLPPQNAEQIEALAQLWPKSKDGRIRLRVHFALLTGEQGMVAPQIAAIGG